MFSNQELSQMKVVYKCTEMPEDLQNYVLELAKTAMTMYTVEKDIAKHVKCELDGNKGGIWHAIVGKNFGSYVTHDKSNFVYFCIGEMSFLVFRIG